LAGNEATKQYVLLFYQKEKKMMRKVCLSIGFVLVVLAGMLASPVFIGSDRALAAPDIFASPVHGGCYIAGPSDCRIHVEPFTINLAVSRKLVFFQLIAIQGGTGLQKVIYDFRPDQSNPVPTSGSTYTPSLVAQDFAATCGQSYMISLQGKDTGDAGAFNLGLTGQFTCPASMP
jgi:hypothetical protein